MPGADRALWHTLLKRCRALLTPIGAPGSLHTVPLMNGHYMDNTWTIPHGQHGYLCDAFRVVDMWRWHTPTVTHQ